MAALACSTHQHGQGRCTWDQFAFRQHQCLAQRHLPQAPKQRIHVPWESTRIRHINGTSRIPHPLGCQEWRLTQRLLYSQDLRWCSMEESSECFAFKYLRINVVPLLFSCCPTANSTTQKTGQTRFWFRLVLCLMRPRRSREKCLIRGSVLVSLLTTWEKDSSAYRCEQILIGECPKKKAGPSPFLLYQANNRATTKKHLYYILYE